MGRKRDKQRERGRGAEKCVSEHWVTLPLNLSTSKVSSQGWGLDGWGRGWWGGEFQREERGRKVKGCTRGFSRRWDSLKKKVNKYEKSAGGVEGKKSLIFNVYLCIKELWYLENKKIYDTEWMTRPHFSKASIIKISKINRRVESKTF